MAQKRLCLVDVSMHFPEEWEKRYMFRALEINGGALASRALEDWRGRPGGDYGKILKVAKIVGEYRRPLDPKHVKPDDAKSGVYEMRAHKGSARLMYFYAPPPHESSPYEGVVILLNSYWKAKPSPTEQERAFQAAREMMNLAQRNLDQLYDDCFEERARKQKDGRR